MEARIFRATLLVATLLVSAGASHRTPNFVVHTQSPELAKRLGTTAEQCRRDLAVLWIGHHLPNWSAPCVMTVHAGSHLGAGGATTFVFDRGEVIDWRMTIQGSPERLLDSVLPHEITHMIFACHFRQPLPRWADEGGATSVEHSCELTRHRKMLIEFLKTNRGIPFNRMFAMTEYPRDVMPLYAQGYSLAEFLIQKGGHRKYVEFLGDGLKSGRWADAIQRHYGTPNIGTLQNTWLAWVRRGSPRLQPETSPRAEILAVSGKFERFGPNPIHHPGTTNLAAPTQNGPIGPKPPHMATAAATPSVSPSRVLSTSGWHASGTRSAATPRLATVPTPRPLETSSAPIRVQTAHPQPIEKSRQIILEWAHR